MNNSTLAKIAFLLLSTSSLGVYSASAFSFSLMSLEERSPVVEKFVGTLFQTSNKLGAALIGEITSISTTTGMMSLISKQKTYSIAVSPDVKVRKFGLPDHLENVKAGDKVSVVSSVSKNDAIKLRARVISILSQENESKYIVVPATTTEIIATSTEVLLPPVASSTEIETLPVSK